MRLNHEYWCEPECTWQTNSINKTAKLPVQFAKQAQVKDLTVGLPDFAQLQCIYYLVLYTDLKAAEGN